MRKQIKATKKTPVKSPVVRAYRISDETHVKLKELAKEDDRKIGSKLTELINRAHEGMVAARSAVS